MKNRLRKFGTLFFMPVVVLCADTLVDLSRAENILGGDLPAVLVASHGPYFVGSDIYVPLNSTVIIEEGSILLFENFSTFHVQGKLTARGSETKPIIFTSVNDREYNPHSSLDPAPYDWNGIIIHPEAIGSILSKCSLRYSVFGIDAHTRFVKIDAIHAEKNGRGALVMEGIDMKIGDSTFNWTVSATDPSMQNIPLTVLRDPRAPARNSLRYGGLLVFAAATVAGVNRASTYSHSAGEFNALSSKNIDNLAANSSDDWRDAQRRKNGDLLFTVGSFILSAAAVSAFWWSFSF